MSQADPGLLYYWFPMHSVFGGGNGALSGLWWTSGCATQTPLHGQTILTTETAAPIWGSPLLNGASAPKMQVFPELSTFSDWSRGSSLPQVLI